MIRKTIKEFIRERNKQIKKSEYFIDKELLKLEIKTLELVLSEVERMKCTLIKNNDFDDTYYECTNCKEDWFLPDGTPKDNNYNYCPNCGFKIKYGG